MADVEEMNYVVGRGRLFFGQFPKGTKKARGQLYFGNTPALSTSQSEQTLDHYSSEGGIRIKDASVSLQNDSSGSFQCDNISLENLALWFRGQKVSRIEAGSTLASATVTFSTAVPADGDSVTINGNAITFKTANPVGMQVLIAATIAAQATALKDFVNALSASLGVTATSSGAVVTLHAVEPGTDGNAITLAKSGTNIAVSGATLAGGTDVTETFDNVQLGTWLQLGVTEDTPQGVRNVGSVDITGVDPDSYVVEEATGRIYLNSDASDILDTGSIDVTYGVRSQTENVVIAKGEPIYGELQFIADNAAGENKDYFWPYIRLTPDGDLPLKGDDWQAMTFNFEILKRDSVTERQYITSRPG